MIAYANSLRRLSRAEIRRTQDALRERLDDPKLAFLLRVDSAELESDRGPVRVEWTNRQAATDEEIERIPDDELKLARIVGESLGVIPIHSHFNFAGGRRRMLVEVAGPRPVTREELQRCQQRVYEELGAPFELNLWFRSDYVVSERGYTTYEELTSPELEDRSRILRSIFDASVAEATPTDPPGPSTPDDGAP